MFRTSTLPTFSDATFFPRADDFVDVDGFVDAFLVTIFFLVLLVD